MTLPVTRPRRRDDLTTVELDGEAVVYDEVNGRLHHLNVPAAIVLSLCEGDLTVEEIARELSEAFRLELDAVIPDVRAAVASFAENDLLS